ncbi:T9SS type A sorting domain-containing protein [Owenweeksia hongkongensis]|uniref:T9SS type A sorting domain-containing protein n=1 Tax=Owenweeksia hongkongensis TaxID=253245 RepID=UPI003A8FA839
MKKILPLLLISLFASSTFASHLLGGEITWEKVASSQYRFKLILYKECGAGVVPLNSYQDIVGPNGSFRASRISIDEISPACTGNGRVYCGLSPSGSGAVERYVYRSAVQTIFGAPPASGWDFSFSTCCRPGSVVNLINASSSSFYITSTMYPGDLSSSPYFTYTPSQPLTNFNSTYSVRALPDNSEDSLYHSLVNAKSSATASVGYSQGYNGASPFPSSATNASNGALSIDGNTGLITYNSQVAVQGLYAYAVEVEQWRKGVLLSRITREFSVVYNSNSPSNNAPNVQIDTSTYKNVIQLSDYAYKAYVTVGDTLDFAVSGIDWDLRQSGSTPQVISFDAISSSLHTSYSTQGLTDGAVLAPVSPQVGYSNALSNNVHFNWEITESHFNYSNNSHFFDFVFNDDQCPYPGKTIITLEVVVNKVANVSSNIVKACAGDSIQLGGYTKSGVYSWSPTVGLSDPTIANPKLLPSVSGYYFLSDPINGAVDSAYIDVTQSSAFTLAQNGSTVELTDGNPATTIVWNYNGIPFTHTHHILPILGFGNYWVKGNYISCLLLSDTVNINSGTSFSVSDTSEGSYNGSNVEVAGSHGMTFSLSHISNLKSISIPGLQNLYPNGWLGYDINIKIYDQNQTEVLSKNTFLPRPMYGLITIPLHYRFLPNVDYTIAVSGDSAYTFSMFENVSYPMTPFHNGITVKGSYEGSYGQFPALPSDYLLPFVLNTDVQVVGLAEAKTSSFKIYPNPAAHQFTIDGLNEESTIQILDLNGKLIQTIDTKEKSLTVEKGNLNSGIYFAKIVSSNITSIQKVMVE